MSRFSGRAPGPADGVPGYWMAETSGVLEPVVRKYLACASATTSQGKRWTRDG